jgi:hypothetical protein
MDIINQQAKTAALFKVSRVYVKAKGVAESKRLHPTILQASKAMIGQIITDVVAGFKLFVSVAEQQGHLRG